MGKREGVYRIICCKGYEVLWYGEEIGSIPYYYILYKGYEVLWYGEENGSIILYVVDVS